jgi:4-hydroxy-tetrahydrodipicolinate synthase
MRNKIEGVLTAIVTPLTLKVPLICPVWRARLHASWMPERHFLRGTNGEFFVLNEEEKVSVTRTCVETVAGRAPVVAHIGRSLPEKPCVWGNGLLHWAWMPCRSLPPGLYR